MRLILLTPAKTLFDGEVKSVTIPGTKGLFTVLPQHAPLITTIGKGLLSFSTEDGIQSFRVEDGFADVKNNEVSVCIESFQKD
jgi:F-type H+-transporting ATPase subunit epsilon